MAENENGNGRTHNGNYRAEQFIDAIQGSGGIISAIAHRVGCTWHTAKRYITTMPTVLQAYNDECEKLIDRAEAKLIEHINDGDMTAITWYLARKGKHRGYTERQELTGADGGPIQVAGFDAALKRAYGNGNDDNDAA
jgi:hypothetical protein